MRFWAGLTLGLMALGGYIGYQKYQASLDPCLNYCGIGTHCIGGVCRPPDVEEGLSLVKKKRTPRRRGSISVFKTQSSEGLRKLTPADLAATTRGPSLHGIDYVNLTGEDKAESELTTDEVTEKFRQLDERIVACIEAARGEYEIPQSQVLIEFRIERSGQIQKVRLSAPALLQRADLYGCIKPLVSSLRFRPSSRTVIMHYPYAIN